MSIHDLGRYEGSLFFVMPLVQGANLHALLRSGAVLGEELLEVTGYSVLAAANGAEALALAEDHATGPIQVLLTEVVMPGTGGA